MSKHSTHDRLSWVNRELDLLREGGVCRQLCTRQGPQAAGLRLDDWQGTSFGSNDYLGLAGDRRVAEAVAVALGDQGWGSGASPLLSGHAE
ncbi:MAG TPA: 8-amino-7-oxononanoate synthase, partial [Thermoguttaceae bacterium]|nr:8-amino-7-oxononanoate synthase [Thermoguttaceae bacterium]